MLDAYEAYVNALPTGYAIWSPIVGVLCGYSLVWSITDSGMMARYGGSGFYRRRMWRSLAGIVCCIAVLWPVPIIAWLVLSFIPDWLHNRSEADAMFAYEKKRART